LFSCGIKLSLKWEDLGAGMVEVEMIDKDKFEEICARIGGVNWGEINPKEVLGSVYYIQACVVTNKFFKKITPS